MFTGLVEEVGRVRDLAAPQGGITGLSIACEAVLEGTAIGDSIAVNGVCLTVTALGDDGFDTEMMGETTDLTALGDLVPGSPVNLERAMLAGARLGGHLVQGHVDGVGRITAIEAQDEWTTVTYALPEDLARYVVPKGSITVDGTSLTVMRLGEAAFSVGLIPHTLDATTHGHREVGDRVNLEVDVIAKYVERMLAGGAGSVYSVTGTGTGTDVVADGAAA